MSDTNNLEQDLEFDNKQEESSSFNFVITAVALAICFVGPWLCIGAWHIRQKIKRNRIQS